MDSWTPQQVALMKAGGNEKCAEYLKKTGVPADAPIKEKYESAQAQHYKEVLKARVEGRPEPSFGYVSTGTGKEQQQRKPPSFEEADRSISRNETFSMMVPLVWHVMLSQNAMRRVLLVAFFGAVALFGGSCVNPKLWSILLLYIGMAVVLLLLGLIFVYVLSGVISRNRQPAFKSARNLLTERIKSGRAQRRDAGFDLFLPPNDCIKTGSKVRLGFIFIPGALVENAAYSHVAATLSDAGFLVAVVNLDPQRFAAVMTKEDVLAIMASISVGENKIDVSEWAIGGHSMGATAAANLIQDLNGLTKLVLWGFCTDKEMTCSLRKANVSALVMNASNDAYYCMCKGNGLFKKMKLSLPPEEEKTETTSRKHGATVYKLIEGGNHSGFAHYGPQRFPFDDGERSITLDDQQKLCTKLTIEFLEQNLSSNTKK